MEVRGQSAGVGALVPPCGLRDGTEVSGFGSKHVHTPSPRAHPCLLNGLNVAPARTWQCTPITAALGNWKGEIRNSKPACLKNKEIKTVVVNLLHGMHVVSMVHSAQK